MKNIDWSFFIQRIIIYADLESIYEAWVKSEELEKWFLSSASYYDENRQRIASSVMARKGHKYSWSWYSQETAEHGSILEANGKDKFVFSFAGDCKVFVELEALEDGVLLTLTQRDIPLDDESKKNIWMGCSSGWSFFIVNLKSLLEGGIDLRNKKKISRLVNN